MVYGIYHVTKNSASITLFLQQGIRLDNGRKPNICPRMRYREKALSSNTWSIFTVMIRVERKHKKIQQANASMSWRSYQTDRTAGPTKDHRKSLSMAQPESTSHTGIPQSTLLDRVPSQLLWVSFFHLHY